MRALARFSLVIAAITLSNSPANAAPLVLDSPTGDVLVVPRSGPGVAPIALATAGRIQATDHQIANTTDVPASKRDAAIDLRIAAQYSLAKGLGDSTEGDHVRASAYFKAANQATDAAQGILSGQATSDDVVTAISMAGATAMKFVTLRDYRSLPPDQLNWAPYTVGAKLWIKAYMFRAFLSDNKSCDVMVPVWSDPTNAVINCP